MNCQRDLKELRSVVSKRGVRKLFVSPPIAAGNKHGFLPAEVANQFSCILRACASPPVEEADIVDEQNGLYPRL